MVHKACVSSSFSETVLLVTGAIAAKCMHGFWQQLRPFWSACVNAVCGLLPCTLVGIFGCVLPWSRAESLSGGLDVSVQVGHDWC
jgi:hypothetical protein